MEEGNSQHAEQASNPKKAHETSSSSSVNKMSQKTSKNPFKTIKGSFGRVKERVMQNIGKVEKTKDDVMDEYVENFHNQRKAVNKIFDEMKTYAYCTRATESSMNDLVDLFLETYEDNWAERETLVTTLENVRTSHMAHAQAMNERIMEVIKEYLGQFPKVSHKVSQLEKRLMDYDHARHSLERLEAHKNDKTDPDKLEKAKEKLQETWKAFEPVHKELIDELPTLFESRPAFFYQQIKNFFESERAFHKEVSVSFDQLVKVLAILEDQDKSGAYKIERKESVIGPAKAKPEEELSEIPKNIE